MTIGIKGQRLVASGLQDELKSSFDLEALKGCNPALYPDPVCIEPPFDEYKLSNFLREESRFSVKSIPDKESSVKKVFMRLWFSVRDEWHDFELFLREISINKKYPVSFLIIGNKNRISCEIGVCRQQETLIRNAIVPRLPNIEIDVNEESCCKDFYKQSKGISEFRDFFPRPPYWRILSNPSNKEGENSLLPVYSVLSSLKEGEFGFFQVVIKPARNEWRNNLLNLMHGDLESSRYGSMNANIYGSSGFVPNDYKDVLSKLEGPFFSVSIRTGCKANNCNVIDSLSLPVLRLTYGNKEFSYITKDDYLKIMSESKFADIIANGLVHRCGMLLTSKEIAAIFNPFPSKQILERDAYDLDKTKGFKAGKQFLSDDGVVLGVNEYANKKVIVTQKESVRAQHTVIFGITGVGKSCLEEAMFLSDVYAGRGAGIIDIHGDLIDRIIRQIPKERIEDVVLFDPTDNDFIASYNPFELFEGEDIGKKVDDLVNNVKVLFSARDWGHQIESILYKVFYLLVIGKDLALSDARILLSKTEEGNALRELLIPQITNDDVCLFWTDSFERMPYSTIERVSNKLSNFLIRENVRRIFSNRVSKINFREIIDNKGIFLGYLPAGRLGDSARILGSSNISAFYHANLSRYNIPPSARVPFTLYIDETVRLGFRHLEDSLRELRKYNTRLVLSFQKKMGLSEEIKQVLGNVGTTITLDTDYDDATRFFREYFSLVDINDFQRKGIGKAFVKMGNSIVNITTPEPKELRDDGYMKEIIELSRQKYCVPVENKTENAMKILCNGKSKELYDEI